MKFLAYMAGILCIFASLYCFGLLFGRLLTEKRWRVISRLQAIRQLNKNEEVSELLDLPFKERIIIPLLKKLGEFMESLTPSRIRKQLSQRMIAAGYVKKAAVANFLTMQLILLTALPLLFILFAVMSAASLPKILLFAVMGALVAMILPNLILNNKKNARQKQIAKSLPDALDLLVVSVEAGLGFDMALVKVTEKMKGPLAEEFAGVLNEIRIGKVRRTALKNMAERTGVDQLISFVSAIIQADQLGVSIGNVLRVQADSIRIYQRQRVEEEINKAPIKMLFPLIFFIFPAMFVVILGPAIIHIIKIFANM